MGRTVTSHCSSRPIIQTAGARACIKGRSRVCSIQLMNCDLKTTQIAIQPLPDSSCTVSATLILTLTQGSTSHGCPIALILLVQSCETVSITLAFRRFEVKTSKTIICDLSNSFSLVFLFSLLGRDKFRKKLKDNYILFPRVAGWANIQDTFIIRYE